MTRLAILQYAGDFREAFERFAAGGPETYKSQRYAVDTVGALATRLESVCVVCGMSDTAYDVRLDNGVRAIGLGARGPVDMRAMVAAAQRVDPTHVAIMTPQFRMLLWARRRRLNTVAILADSFASGNWRGRLRNWLMARLLNGENIAFVGNHGRNACRSLAAIGVDPARIIPWDWPPTIDPDGVAIRSRGATPLKLAYVGLVMEGKGVGDLIDAIGLLRRDGRSVTATIIGKDIDGAMQARADAAGLLGQVNFTGMIGNAEAMTAMREADAIVVPSRHDYAEGLPLVIYEALANRTPLVASDHPMFRNVAIDGHSAVVFEAANPVALAAALTRLDDDPVLYRTLSANSAATWRGLQLPVRWGDLFDRWLGDPAGSSRWIKDYCLASGRYDA